MERNLKKKSVRFSSPFDTEFSLLKPQDYDLNSFNISSRKSSFSGRNTLPESDRSPGNPDSWDAFDVKMKKVIPKTSEEMGSQFLELSYSQRKSLSSEDQNFSSMSFQDAKSLLEKDENERLQFVNSNASFSGGLEEIEAPSLLSFTTYFQQGSSFPVPYAGNDSTMMFGEGLAGISSTDIQKLEAQRQAGGRQTRHPVKAKMNLSSTNNNKSLEVHNANANTDLSRKDSLATFFLGSESNGMKKVDIMEYVIDYCKRKASYSSVDTPVPDMPTNNSVDKKSDRRDSGIDTTDKSSVRLFEKENVRTTHKNTTQIYVHKEPEKRSVNFVTSVANNEESVLLADGAPDETGFLDASDVEGFEKFKKNLNLRTKIGTRYRTKAKHNLEFETKRLNDDRQISHPTASPNASLRPGSSASLERPNKKIICNSPPEKLHKSNTSTQSPLPQPVFTNPLGQCHSTPLGNETLVSKYVNLRKDGDVKVVLEDRLDKLVEGNCEFEKEQKLNIIDSDSTITGSSSSGNFSHSHLEKDVTETSKKPKISTEVAMPRTMSPAPVPVIRPNTLSVDPSNISRPIQLLPEGLSILPIIHSGLPQNHSIASQNCSCPHQHSQHQQPSPVIPGVGMPIVIHIHLPCTMTHPASTPNNGNSK